jgi:hypothetical protein
MHLVHLFSFYRFHPQMSAHSSYAWQSSLIWLPIFLRDFLHLLHSLCLQINLFICNPCPSLWHMANWVGCLPIWMVSKDHICEHTLPIGCFPKWKLPSTKGWILLPPRQAMSLYTSRSSILKWLVVQILRLIEHYQLQERACK